MFNLKKLGSLMPLTTSRFFLNRQNDKNFGVDSALTETRVALIAAKKNVLGVISRGFPALLVTFFLISPVSGDEATPAPSTVDQSGLIIAIVSLALITILSLSITFWLYRWRKRFTDKYEIVVPENWHAVSDHHNNKLNKQEIRIDQLTQALNQLGTQSQGLQKNIENMIESYLALQSHIDTQDKEIVRLREGYDAEIFRRFLNRFIRVDKAIQESVDDETISVEDLEQIKQLLEDAFDECGLVIFEPVLGQDYAQAEGVADNPKIIPNQDPALVGKIAEVRECGYQLQETGKIVRPAKVSICGPVN